MDIFLVLVFGTHAQSVSSPFNYIIYAGAWITRSVNWLGNGLNVWEIVVQFPVGTRDLALIHSAQTDSVANVVAALFSGHCSLFTRGAKWPECKSDHSVPSGVEVRSAWSQQNLTSTPHTFTWYGAQLNTGTLPFSGAQMTCRCLRSLDY
jgi:hypothetical protein